MSRPVTIAAVTLALSALCGLALPATALAETYRCTTHDFQGFEDNATFKAQNRQKTFVLDLRGNDIWVETKSAHFDDSKSYYRVFERSALSIYAAEENNPMRSTLSVPPDPARLIRSDGYFEASIVLQSTFIANSWLLRCTN